MYYLNLKMLRFKMIFNKINFFRNWNINYCNYFQWDYYRIQGAAKILPTYTHPSKYTSHIMVKHDLNEDTVATNVLQLSGRYFWEVYVGGILASPCNAELLLVTIIFSERILVQNWYISSCAHFLWYYETE